MTASSGLRVAPFRALRFAVDGPDLAARLSPPYDVIDESEQQRLEGHNEFNVVRLILPRGDDAGPNSRYARAAATLATWRRDDILVEDPTPAIYVYEMATEHSRTRGLLTLIGLTPYEEGVVLPHENTMAGPVADRLALTEAAQANLEPIYLVYDGGGAATDAVRKVDQQQPLQDTTTDDGIRHRVWAITDESVVTAIADDLRRRRAVIADGHHRYATYLRHQTDRSMSRATTDKPWDYGLTFLVDAGEFGPTVHAIHRVIPSLPLAEAVHRAAAGFTITAVDGPADAALNRLASAGAGSPAYLLTDGQSWQLLTDPDPAAIARTIPSDHDEAWRQLDVTVAHRLLIADLLGLNDQEGTVDFEHDVDAAIRRAAGGTALLLNPTPVSAVAAVAAAGERMPRKSTLFTPKPRTGLVIRPYDA